MPTQRKPPVKFDGEPSDAAAAVAAPDASADVKDLRRAPAWFVYKELRLTAEFYCTVGPTNSKSKSVKLNDNMVK